MSRRATLLARSPTSDGSACAVVVSERFLDGLDSADRAVEVVAQSMVTDLESTFSEQSARSIVGARMTAKAAQDVYEAAEVGPEDVQVIELHDCFASNELISYEALGLCGEGEAGRLIDEGGHVRQQVGGEHVRRADLQGPPARRDRPGAVLGAHVAAARDG